MNGVIPRNLSPISRPSQPTLIVEDPSLSFSKKKLRYLIARNLKEQSPNSSRLELLLNQSIQEAENENEDDILMDSGCSLKNHKEPRNIFLTHKNYDQGQYNELSQGPKFKNNGQVIPYSIVGKSDSFMKNHNIVKSKGISDTTYLKSFTALDEKTPRSTTLRKDPPIRNSNGSNNNQAMLSRKQSFRSVSDSIEKEKNSVSPNNGLRKPKLKKANRDDLLREIQKFEEKRKELKMRDEIELKSLKRSDFLTATKEGRILDRFEQNNSKWKQNIEKLCNSIGRNLDETVMLQYEEYRRNREKADEIERIKESIKKRVAVEDERSELFWYLSLRNYPKDSSNLQQRFNSHNKCKHIEDENGLMRMGKLTLMQDLPFGFQTGVVESHQREPEKIREPFLKSIRGNGSINRSNASTLTNKYNLNVLEGASPNNSLFRKANQDDELNELEIVGRSLLEIEKEAILRDPEPQVYIRNPTPNNEENNAEETIAENYDFKCLVRNGTQVLAKLRLNG